MNNIFYYFWPVRKNSLIRKWKRKENVRIESRKKNQSLFTKHFYKFYFIRQIFSLVNKIFVFFFLCIFSFFFSFDCIMRLSGRSRNTAKKKKKKRVSKWALKKFFYCSDWIELQKSSERKKERKEEDDEGRKEAGVKFGCAFIRSSKNLLFLLPLLQLHKF